MERRILLNENEREYKRDVGTESETHVHIGYGEEVSKRGGGGVEGEEIETISEEMTNFFFQ